ncbi:Zinc finger RNA-binding protein 2 [Microtus ochrogaster]|uniref:Zinc finger RNA-binding protein 2 n=1 Tax=Microtus ochrogaster TaxID=79684 RepID=A0A8J6G6S0_MICOH|nr:Zinc finger RNA-binding protein 2 [Microtus ochrogaster]
MLCDPSFTSDALPFLDRLPKPKVGPRLPFRHYCKVCRAVDLWRPLGRTEAPDEAGDSEKRHTAQQRSERGQKLHYVLCAVSCTRADAYAAHMRGVRHQKVSKLHTRPISSEPMPGSVTSDRTLRPQACRELTPITDYTPQL